MTLLQYLYDSELARLAELELELVTAKRTLGNLNAEKGRLKRRAASRREAARVATEARV